MLLRPTSFCSLALVRGRNSTHRLYKKYALFFASCLRGVESWMVDLSESVVNNERGPLTQLT